MKHVLSAAILTTILAVPVLAHGDNDHVRGTVTSITAQAIVVKVTGAAPRTLTIDNKTIFLHGGKGAQLADVKVGDRVVVDVPKKTDRAGEVNFSSPAPATRPAVKK
jgi:hypothetical protein